MNTIKNISAFLLFSIFINAFGYIYLGGFSLDTQVAETTVELPNIPSLYTKLAVVDEDDLICLAENVYHEARGQSTEGRLAVAFVTMNRVNHARYPDTVCGVVYQPSQFSWTAQKPVVDFGNVIERKAWDEIVELSRGVLDGTHYNNMYGITHYHATYVNPVWAENAVVQIDDHVFYNGDNI